MIAAMVMPGKVVAADGAGRVRMEGRDGWVSPWVKWHSQAAGKARHWREPSVGEGGTLFNPSGVPGAGTFVPGLFSDAGTAPDDRDHVDVWEFDDGGRIVYDWKAKTYDITLPTGTVTIKVAGSTVTVADAGITLQAPAIKLVGPTEIDGPLHVTGAVIGDSTIMDAGGNSNHHSH
jgi:phage baseplate assembly protein V